jgi:nicotine blue oxidoreductase
MSTTTIRGIVLAAGEGRRMGSPKALLDLDGTTLVELHVERLLEVGCSSIVVVVRPGAAPAVSALLREHTAVHVEAVATRSQAESLAAALRVLDGSSMGDIIIVTPVDMVPAEATTHAALLASLTGAALAATPVYGERGGHPVIAYRSVLAAYETAAEAGTAPPSLRDVLAEAGSDRRRVEVDDENVVGDLDTPADLRALASRRGSDVARVAGAGRR